MKRTPVKYTLSSSLALDDSTDVKVDRVLHNTFTGQRLRVSKETMPILAQFRKSSTIKQVSKRLRLENGAQSQFKTIIAKLVQSGILIGSEQSESDLLASINVNDHVTTPRNTFMHCLPGDYKIEAKRVAIVGVPMDFATTGDAGAKLAPEALRNMSVKIARIDRDIFNGKSKGIYSYALQKTILKGSDFADCGDIIHVLSENPGESYSRIESVATRLFQRRNLPVFLGGDHSITAPLVKACAKVHGKHIQLVQLDAHTDLAEWRSGTSHHHGNVMSRVLAENPLLRLWQYGVRGFGTDKNSNTRVTQVPQSRIGRLRDVKKVPIPRNGKCYITIDIDVLSPCFAPGTGTPVAMGMDPYDLLCIIEAVSAHNTIVGIDLVEVNPVRDHNDLTISTAVSILIDVLGFALSSPR